jgi:DNA-binding NarL/FixJ family response regulator
VVTGRDRLLMHGVAALLRDRGWRRVDVVPLGDAVGACRRAKAGTLVVDVGAIEDARHIRAALAAVKGLVAMACVGERNPYLVRELQSAGAKIIVHRSSDDAEIERAIQAARAGTAFL